MAGKTPGGDTRLGGLDAFRFLLCMAVVVMHYWVLGPQGFGNGAWPQVNIPQLAVFEYVVHAFFMISGFAVMYTIKGRTAVAFAIARFARMWPAIAICSVITWLMTRHQFVWAPGTMQVAQSWTIIPLGFDRGAGADWSYWTLCFELRFYLFVFLAMVVADVHKFRLPLVALWLAITAYDVAAPGNAVAHFIALDWYASCFIIGALTYIMWEHRGLVRTIAAALLPVAFVVMAQQVKGEDANFNEAWRVIPNIDVTMWIVPPLCWGLLVLSLMINKPFAGPLMAKTVAFLGAATYPLYLLHQLAGYRMINDLERIPLKLHHSRRVGSTHEPRLG